jgi:3-hydroxyacyl-[acyl-carrier-protein] dehydratase
MPRQILYDIDSVDLDRVQFTIEDIEARNPQRDEFAQLQTIAYFDPDEEIIVSVRDLKEDEFWTRGHMPDRPIFPGVLMLESAAQLCSFYTRKVMAMDLLYGFGGADKVRFRRMATPGDRFILLAHPQTITPRRSLFKTQGIIDGKIAFEAEILGIALPDRNEPDRNEPDRNEPDRNEPDRNEPDRNEPDQNE